MLEARGRAVSVVLAAVLCIAAAAPVAAADGDERRGDVQPVATEALAPCEEVCLMVEDDAEGPVAVSVFGDADGELAAVSATGNASGEWDGAGCEAISPYGLHVHPCGATPVVVAGEDGEKGQVVVAGGDAEAGSECVIVSSLGPRLQVCGSGVAVAGEDAEARTLAVAPTGEAHERYGACADGKLRVAVLLLLIGVGITLASAEACTGGYAVDEDGFRGRGPCGSAGAITVGYESVCLPNPGVG